MPRRKSPLWNLLKRITWEAAQGKAGDYILTIKDRLSPSGTRTITGDMIEKLTPTGALQLKDGSQIPPHRVEAIRKNNRTLYPPPGSPYEDEARDA